MEALWKPTHKLINVPEDAKIISIYRPGPVAAIRIEDDREPFYPGRADYELGVRRPDWNEGLKKWQTVTEATKSIEGTPYAYESVLEETICGIADRVRAMRQSGRLTPEVLHHIRTYFHIKNITAVRLEVK